MHFCKYTGFIFNANKKRIKYFLVFTGEVMRCISRLFILSMGLFLFFGCAARQYEKHETRLIIFKTAKIKYADLGYIRHNKDAVKIDLFMAGQAARSIEVGKSVCFEEGCMSRSDFNKEYLHPSYPDAFLLNVLLGRPIFEKAAIAQTAQGFTQEIQSAEYDILYRVENSEIYFKDKKNMILIKISKTKG